jgi:hypothetical protein
VLERAQPRTIIVNCMQDLSVLHESGIGSRPTHVLLRLPHASGDAATDWETRLNRLFSECGCKLGTGFALLALFGSVAWQCAYSDWRFTNWPGFLFRSLLALLLGGMSGKRLSIGLARRRIRMIAAQIRDASADGTCGIRMSARKAAHFNRVR